jgi:hypothetical protein
VLKVFVSLMSIGVLALSPVTQSAIAATPAAQPVVVPASVPPPDPGDTYASVYGISHSCNANNICQGTFSGSASLTGWARATLHVYVNLYANGTKLGSNSHICYAATSCSVSDGPVTFNYIFGQTPQVCATASGQAQYSNGPAVADDQECWYIGGGGGTAIANP